MMDGGASRGGWFWATIALLFVIGYLVFLAPQVPGRLTAYVGVGGFALGAGVVVWYYRREKGFTVGSVRALVLRAVEKEDSALAKDLRTSGYDVEALSMTEFGVEFYHVGMTYHYDVLRGLLGQKRGSIEDLRRVLKERFAQQPVSGMEQPLVQGVRQRGDHAREDFL